MIDPFGRSISFLRVSVTDRCDKSGVAMRFPRVHRIR
jgi:hypothetical protein